MTLVTITPRGSVVRDVLALLTKPSPVFVDYGGTHWRLASSPSAVNLMLNVPISNPAFTALPLTPFAGISVSVPADLEFSLVQVGSSVRPGA